MHVRSRRQRISTCWRSCAHLDVRHDEVGDIESLRLGVGLSVLQQVQHEAARLLGPASLGGVVTLRNSQNTHTEQQDRRVSREIAEQD